MKAIVLMHEKTEGPGTLGEFLKLNNVEVEIVKLYDGDMIPVEFDAIDMIISMGGPMNVYQEEEYPFLKSETRFLRRAIDESKPVMGICLGAQMIAKACDAKVYKGPVKEVGWCQVRLTEDGMGDLLFSGLPELLEVFQWHEDTFDIPAEGKLLATSMECPHQALRHKNAYGLQFHVEVTKEILSAWFDESEEKTEILSRFDEIENLLNDQAQKMYRNFLSLAEACPR